MTRAPSRPVSSPVAHNILPFLGRRLDFALLSAWLVSSLFAAWSSFRAPGHDFRGFYAAARVVAADGNPYDYRQLAPVMLSVTGHMGNNPYYYPPWFAWCFHPFCLFPFQAARALWLLLNLALWIWALCALSRLLHWPEPGWRRWSAFFLATLLFARVTMWYEQVGIVLLALFVAFLASAARRRWCLAGVWLALLLVKPNVTLLPVTVLAAWLGRRRRWRPAVVALVCIISLLAAATVADPTWYRPLFRHGFGRGLYVSLDGPDLVTAVKINTTLMDWLGLLQVPAPCRAPLYGIAVGCGVLSCAVTALRSKSLLQVAAVSLLVGFATTPYAVQYDYPALAIPWFLAGASSRDSKLSFYLFCGVTAFLVTVLVLERPVSEGYWLVIGILWLTLWTSRQATRQGAGTASHAADTAI